MCVTRKGMVYVCNKRWCMVMVYVCNKRWMVYVCNEERDGVCV